MTDRRFVKPRDGLTVRDPDAPGAPPLPPQGKAVTWGSYWTRRVNDGDVEMTSAAAIAAAEKKAAAVDPAPLKGDAK